MITIFSKPIHSGKTTQLLKWVEKQSLCAGILMPDISECRNFYNISTKKYFIAQCIETNLVDETIINIGKYQFYVDAFERANEIIIKSIDSNCKYIIIDEVGKLELQEKGFHQSIKFVLENYATAKKNLLLVVRDSLVNKVVNFYNLKNYHIIHSIKEMQ